ncbi:MAG: response regulator [Polaromonas sp.]|nr:response regulator [Polaromonas sp.]
MANAEKEVLKPWCVVIIDDSLEDRAEIRRLLLKGSDRRLSFIEAGTAEAGIQAVLGAVLPPDCIMLDYNLPEMEAPDVLAALKGPDGMPVCPVVVMTGGINREHGRRALRAGAQDYIGKDWSSPQALNRAVENASESWAMARELRQRKDALRRVADRETFRSLFGDATRDLKDEHALKGVASHLLCLHLEASRVMYGEVVGEATLVVGQSYGNGVQQIEGSYNLDDYGPRLLLAALKSGQDIVVPDVAGDCAYSESEKAAYAKLEMGANLLIPIMRNGALAAVLGVHQKTPRDWTPEDLSIAREIAERTWSAVEHARAEGNLLAKERQLSEMMQVMPSFSAVLAGPRFVFQLANQSYFDLIGRGPEIIGKTLVEALPEIVVQPFPALLEEVYRTGKPFEAKSMVVSVPRGPGGSLVDIFVDFAYLPLHEADGHVTGIFVHGVDRTAEVRVTQELARRQRELRNVTENTPNSLARFDRQFRHVFANSVIKKITGRPVAEILGKTSREVGMPQELCEEWEKAIRHVFDHAVHGSLDFSFPTPEGLRHFSSRLVPEFNEHRQVEFVLAVTHDVTDRRAYEQQLLEQDLRKNEFLATLAHELRNPLAPIRTGLQLLQLSAKSDVAARTLPVIERQLGHMVRLVDDLLDVSRISSGKIVLQRKRVAFQEVAAAAVEASRPFIDALAHSLILEWPDQPVWLDADPTRLAQIFSNLLTNAAKYMRACGQIKFSARQEGDSVLISVRDTGMGIPADMLGTVFDMFMQVNRTLDRSQGGLGIGLSLVKSLVEMHGGSVQAASGGFDLGSEFTVTLPTASVPAAEAAARAEPAARPVNPPVAGHRILVVDDNVDAAETMAMLLELSGHETRTAFCGQEALEIARSFRPNVVFLDIGLPDINGYEVARRLLADPATATTRLIALTGWGTEEDIRKSKMAGFHAHMTKPADPDAVEGMLASVLQVRAAT